ncbi:hypothetical protein [Nisaea sp.]|uniref:hypothetical protein n=1 Tax=Nisaea sp. TaxID=2024842 RepID=UPI00329689BC
MSENDKLKVLCRIRENLVSDIDAADAVLKQMEQKLIDPKFEADRAENERIQKRAHSQKLFLLRKMYGLDVRISQIDPSHVGYTAEVRRKEDQAQIAELKSARVQDEKLARDTADTASKQAKHPPVLKALKERPDKVPGTPEKKPSVWRRAVKAVARTKKNRKEQDREFGIGEDD